MLQIIKSAKSIKATPPTSEAGGQFVDLSQHVDAQLDQARQEVAQILAAARDKSEQVRSEAEQRGQKQADQNFDQRVSEEVQRQLASLCPALENAIVSLRQARSDHLKQCENGVLRLATAIAERLVRRELEQTPEITLELLRESLELAAGSRKISVLVNPTDYETLGLEIRQLVASRGDGVCTEIEPDARVSRGGCIVQTEFGSIDQRFESQLARILEELD